MIVIADDPLSEAGAIAYVRRVPRLLLLPPHRVEEARVILALAHAMNGTMLERLAGLRRTAARAGRPGPRVVLVAEEITAAQVAAAEAVGLCALFRRRETEFAEIVRAVLEPPVRERRRPAARDGRRPAGAPAGARGPLAAAHREGARERALSPREIAVLELLATGMTTDEIARRLNYSPRTIKGVIHDMLKRLGLRSRAHAVAYAMRERVL
jgi:DNA-binding NarL/FixJ family response regulator